MKYKVEYMVDSIGKATAIVQAETVEDAVRAVQASQPGYDVEATNVTPEPFLAPTIIDEPVLFEGGNPEDPAQGSADGDS